jgi:hypothetical protein
MRCDRNCPLRRGTWIGNSSPGEHGHRQHRETHRRRCIPAHSPRQCDPGSRGTRDRVSHVRTTYCRRTRRAPTPRLVRSRLITSTGSARLPALCVAGGPAVSWRAGWRCSDRRCPIRIGDAVRVGNTRRVGRRRRQHQGHPDGGYEHARPPRTTPATTVSMSMEHLCLLRPPVAGHPCRLLRTSDRIGSGESAPQSGRPCSRSVVAHIVIPRGRTEPGESPPQLPWIAAAWRVAAY